MKKLIFTLLLSSALLTLVNGCRTAHGFGEDMQNAGEGIQKGTR